MLSAGMPCKATGQSTATDRHLECAPKKGRITWNLFPDSEHNFPKKMNSLFWFFGEPQIFPSISITHTYLE